jgi:hypothetical protein
MLKMIFYISSQLLIASGHMLCAGRSTATVDDFAFKTGNLSFRGPSTQCSASDAFEQDSTITWYDNGSRVEALIRAKLNVGGLTEYLSSTSKFDRDKERSLRLGIEAHSDFYAWEKHNGYTPQRPGNADVDTA